MKSGAIVVLHLVNLSEKYWGVLESLAEPGITLRGISLTRRLRGSVEGNYPVEALTVFGIRDPPIRRYAAVQEQMPEILARPVPADAPGPVGGQVMDRLSK